VAKGLAGEGQLDEAQVLFVRSLSAESQRYVMLAPPGSNLEVHHRVVSLEATLRADGDVIALRALLGELRALAQGQMAREKLSVGRAELGRDFGAEELAKALGKDRMRPEWRAEAAFLAARLCRGAEANALLEAVPDRYLASVVSPQNLLLTELRIGNFARAERRLAYLEAKLETPEKIVTHSTLAALNERAQRARQASERARTQPEPQRSLVLGATRTELGLYLCALRQLRPAYEQAGPNQAPQYVQLLLAAGLVQEALRELERAFPPDVARRHLTELQAGLSERVLDQTSVTEPSPWWPPRPDEQL
jgi:hypothetical protein